MSDQVSEQHIENVFVDWDQMLTMLTNTIAMNTELTDFAGFSSMNA